MNFKSDNTVAVNKEIMQALLDTNHGFQNSYGNDHYSQELQKRLSIIFETEVVVYLTNTGTAANSLALSALVKPYEAIFCSDQAHIYIDECGAPELFTGGSLLIPLGSNQGKINFQQLDAKVQSLLAHRPHAQKPGCVSITQATECGTIYAIDELKEISTTCKKYDLPLHMDGARFANSLVASNATPADLTWKAGVDVLSFGATKNGALCAEAVIFFNKKYAHDFDYLHKRAGQLMSKTRFFACQLLAYLENDLWLNNARHANIMAQELAQVFHQHNIVPIYPVQANELFVTLTSACAEYLQQQGCGFYSWGAVDSNLYRFVTSWMTSAADIEALSNCLNLLK